MNVFDFLKQHNRPTTIDRTYQAYIDIWEQWYKGKVDKFHNYPEQIGDFVQNCERSSFDAAEMVSRDWAKLLINENFKFKVDGDEQVQNKLDEILKDVKFIKRGGLLTELVFAMGTGATVQYLDDKGRIRQKYIRASMIYPLSYENGEITECAFGSKKTIDGENYLYVETHTKGESGLYVVDNFVLKDVGNSEEYTEVTSNFDIAEKWETNSTIPCFQIFEPNVVNTYDFDSPMGMSIFGNAIDNLKAIDVTYDSYVNEFVLGIKRVYVSDNGIQWEKDADGNRVMKANIDSRVIRYFPFDGDFMQQIDFTLRVDEHNRAMQDQLNYLSSKCGLGTNHFKYDASAGATTATEIISTNSEKYKSMVSHQNGFTEPLVNMAKKLLELGGYPDVKVEPVFDDSIIRDTETESDTARKEVSQGLRSKLDYLTDPVTGRGMSEADAMKELEQIATEKKNEAVVDFDFTGGD